METIQVPPHSIRRFTHAPPESEDAFEQRKFEMCGELETALLERLDGFVDHVVGVPVGHVCEVAQEAVVGAFGITSPGTAVHHARSLMGV